MDTPTATTFWKTLAGELEQGGTLLMAVNAAAGGISDANQQRFVRDIIAELERGVSLGVLMDRHGEAFPAPVRWIWRAGEYGGVLDVAARNIALGYARQAFPIPAEGSSNATGAAVLRALGLMLASGVPVLETMELLLKEELPDPVRSSLQTVKEGVEARRSLAEIFEQHSDLFPPDLARLLSEAESGGMLDSALLKAADALEAGHEAELPGEYRLQRPPSLAEAYQGGPADPAKIVDLVLLQSIRDRSSEIHFEPLASGGTIRFRVDGVLYEMMPPPPEVFGRVVDHVKQLAGMSATERRLPQDGRANLKLDDRDLMLLVSSTPVMHGERLCVRILDRQGIRVGLDQLELAPDNLRAIRRLLQRPRGLILVSGPSASGTTTLLYSMLMHLRQPKRVLVSVEDPVELTFDGISQIGIRPGIGLSFPRAIRAALRQAPDVLMVGDVRDAETMHLALSAAMTWQLVLARFDSDAALNVLRRMMDLGAEPYRINSALLGIVHQRLVRRLCEHCRRPAEPVWHLLPPEAKAIAAQIPNAAFHGPGGCEKCNKTGYRGRVAIQELLVVDEPLRRALAAGTDLYAESAPDLRSLLFDGVTKAAEGFTDIQELATVLAQQPGSGDEGRAA